MENISKINHLVVHMDINKTILMKDSAEFKDSIVKVILFIMSAQTWGVCSNTEDGQLEFNLVSKNMHFEKPKPEECELFDVSESDLLNMMTYKKYLERMHPFVLLTDIPDFSERRKKDKENAKKRELMLDQFIRDESSVGWLLKETFDEMNERISQKKEISTDHKLYPLLNKFHSIVPSFFKFHEYLDSLTAHDPEFSYKIIFRTFGYDHKEIYDEYTEYLKGTHPLFSNSYPKEKLSSKNFANCGNILRSKDKQSDIVLISGMYPNSDLLQDTKEYIFDENLLKVVLKSKVIEHLQKNNYEMFNEEALTFHIGIHEIYSYFTSKEECFMCVQDDYESWKFHDEHSPYAKPLILDLNSTDITQVFFDDNCSPHEHCIVNSIDLSTGESLAYEDNIGKFAIKVDSLQAILDEEYLIKKFLKVKRI
jgi:hypothetical protein